MTTTPNMSCPSGGDFYACGDKSRFVGCCGINPCTDQGCAAGNLVETSFDITQFGEISDQQCSAGQFYTCTGTSPPFWGCCTSNPCAGSGCPAAALAGAFLSNSDTAAQYLSLNSTWSVASSSSSAGSGSISSQSTTSTRSTSTATTSLGYSTSTTASAAPSSSTDIGAASSAATTTAVPAPESQHSDTGAIVGGAVGGFAVLAVLIFGLVWLLRRRRRPDKLPLQDSQPSVQQTPLSPPMLNEKPTSDYTHSPSMPSYPGSPAQDNSQKGSPGPPGYEFEPVQRYELPGTVEHELDGGQSYHPYRVRSPA